MMKPFLINNYKLSAYDFDISFIYEILIVIIAICLKFTVKQQ